MGTTKHYVFTIFFNFNGDKERPWAQKRREDSLVYLTGLFENKAKFTCMARDTGENCLKLSGCVNLTSPCTQSHAKRLIGGKCICCEPSYFGDVVSLCQLIHMDQDLTVVGRLPVNPGSAGLTGKLKSFQGDPKFVVKCC